MRLHITNGDCANEALDKAGIEGTKVAWSDPLHHGPVPAGLGLRELSRMRARFLSESGGLPLQSVQEDFDSRDSALQSSQDYEVYLWSTLELFDQLHLLQLLSWFESHGAVRTPPKIVWVWDHLGTNSEADELHEALAEARVAQPSTMGTAAAIWQSFTQPLPNELVLWSGRAMPDLPFMGPALRRLLEELPGVDDGLTRTQRQALQILEPGSVGLGDLFLQSQALEKTAFMGDLSFWIEIEPLVRSERPLMVAEDGGKIALPLDGPEGWQTLKLELNDRGKDVLAGEQDFLRGNPVERWFGGTHLTPENDWRWDSENNQTVKL